MNEKTKTDNSRKATAPNRSILDIQKQTLEEGSWFVKNARTVVLASFAFIIGAASTLGFLYYSNQRKNHVFQKVDAFRRDGLMPLVKKELELTAFLEKLAEKVYEKPLIELSSDIVKRPWNGLHQSWISPILVATDFLIGENRKEEALNLLSIINSSTISTPALKALVLQRQAALEEDLKNLPAAQKALESLLKISGPVFLDKVYLDLGRLYRAQGQEEKAKEMWQYIIDHLKNPEIVKQAKIYLYL